MRVLFPFQAMRTPIHIALCLVQLVHHNIRNVNVNVHIVQPHANIHLHQITAAPTPSLDDDVNIASDIDALSSAVVFQLLLYGALWYQQTDALEYSWLEKYRNVVDQPIKDIKYLEDFPGELLDTKLQSLQHICRTSIRVQVALSSGLHHVKQLPLPPDIVQYLQFTRL